LEADYVRVVEDRLIMSAIYRLPAIFGLNCPTQQSHGLFATTELLVHTAMDTSGDSSYGLTGATWLMFVL